MFVTKEVQTKGKKFYFEFVDMEKACDTLSRSMSNSSPVHIFEPFFWTGQLLDNFRLKDLARFHGSIFNADPHKLQVTWHHVYNDVWLYESYL